MLLAKRGRHFVRHELGFRPLRGNGAALPLVSDDGTQDVASILKAALDGNQATYEVKDKDTVRITKIELREDKNLGIILVRRRDKEASPQVLEHGKTGNLRTPEVATEEAPALSSHLFFSLTRLPGPTPKYRALLEEVPGLGRTYINYILSSVLKSIVYEYEDAKGVKEATYTIPSITGVASETLGDALKGGSIGFVELVREPALDGLDLQGIKTHPQRLRLSVKPDQNGLNIIERVQDWAYPNHWGAVRVQVKTSDDRTKVVDIAEDVEAADILFVRSEVVLTAKDIAVCTDEINEELAELAAAMLSNDEGW